MRNPIAPTIASTIALKIGRRLTELWYSRQAPPRVLRAAAAVYEGALRSRLQRPASRPPCPVIVVGNLVVGGTGKTPVVAALAEALTDAGFAVSIVTRGYGGSGGRAPQRVRADSRSVEVGDEALQLFRQTGRPVWVCRRRAAALEAAVQGGAEVVLSDDGLQHVRMSRSFEICVIDGRRGFGNGYCLPAGPLRQPVARLETVDLVLVKRTDESFGHFPVDDFPYDELGGIAFELESGDLRALHDGIPPPEAPAEIDALAGIADPEPFFRTLASRGYRVRRHALVDHQPITPAILDALPGPVVMTEKDSMRLPPPLPDEPRSDLFVLPVRARLPATVVQRVTGHVREFRS